MQTRLKELREDNDLTQEYCAKNGTKGACPLCSI